MNISPDVTPVLSMARKRRATATLHEWQTDVLDSPAKNAQIEGNTNSASAITATTRSTYGPAGKRFLAALTRITVNILKWGSDRGVKLKNYARTTDKGNSREFDIQSALAI